MCVFCEERKKEGGEKRKERGCIERMCDDGERFFFFNEGMVN